VITLIVPTRNRAHTLRLVAPSYFQQEGVTEIIFVSDAGTDDTLKTIEFIAQTYPHISMRFIRNERRLGASESRNVGVKHARNEYILFCDDDEHLEAGYAKTCLDKLLNLNAGAVSGRRIYLEKGESRAHALQRFSTGLRQCRPFRFLICEYVNAARFEGDLKLPLTNAVIITRKALLQQFPFDPRYAQGNGYREESDFQMNLFTQGYDVYVTNERHSFHLPLSQVRGGGQRTHAFRRIYWSIHYTRYIFGKYYRAYAGRVGLKSPGSVAVCAFAVFSIYRETLRPVIYAVAKWLLRRRQHLAVAQTRG
jgi:glycosyltransferase involved in cell wall biosynthesis